MTQLDPNTPPAPDRMAQFEGHNGRFAGGNRTHTVTEQPWIAGLKVPAPACHTGNSSFDPEVFQPAKEHVDCLRCLKLPNKPATIGTTDPNQLALPINYEEPCNGFPENGPCGIDCVCEDNQPCPDGCSCAWCTGAIFATAPPHMVTLQPDPAYL